MEQNLYAQLCSLSVYRGLLTHPPLAALRALLCALEEGAGSVDQYAEVFYALASEGFDSLAEYLYHHICCDESPFAEAAARGNVSGALEQAARHDLEVLQAVCNLSCGAIKGQLSAQLPKSWRATVTALPEWNTGCSFRYEDLVHFYRVNGSGWFAEHRAFVWQNGTLHPIAAPDYLSEEEMWGYTRQREQVIENTRALMEGRAVNNVLLYGASGTGKSATVKAMLGMPEFEGLRLIEVPREELIGIPQLVRTLGHRPQKFIIFIDDLSFDREDRTFSSLKTILEGSLEPRPANVAVYCTSNRRHLVRQNFSDRSGDEIDANETIQDKTSLAERFGVRILFSELNKAQFLQMVHDLARAAGVTLDENLLQSEAVKWDIRHPSRTPRSAKQFVANMLAKYPRS